MTDRVGASLGAYHLIRLLGRSAFAEVYLGEALSSRTPVAVKVLSLSYTRDEMERVRWAVHTFGRLSHPALLRVRDFGVVDDRPFLVMDYVPQGSLRMRYPRGTMLSLLKHLVPAVQFAHEHSLLHGNLKPENILVGPTHTLLLSDFGLVVGASARRPRLEMLGTPAVVYLAPEQLQDQAQFASDQYALGIMAYEWLSGDVPFHGSVEELVKQQLTVPPPPLRALVPTISSYVEQVVHRALARDPASRFASVQAFAHELEQACQTTQAAPVHLLSPDTRSQLPLIPTVSLSPPSPTRSTPGTRICTYRRHTHYVADVAWSPDGTRLVSASRDKTVQVWDAATARLLFSYLDHVERVNGVTWSPDGTSIASAAGDGTVHVWTADGGRLQFVYRSRVPLVQVVKWSPHGKRLASSGSQQLEIWNAFKGDLLLTILSHAYGINALAWSPNGKAIATGSNDHAVHIWHAIRGDRLLRYSEHGDDVLAVAWSPDGTTLASGGRDHTVHVWEAASGKTRGVYLGHKSSEQEVRTIAWSPNGTFIASGSSEGTVHVWDATTGDTVCIYRGHVTERAFNRINAVAWSPDGSRIASASDDETVQVWWAS